MLLTIDAGNTQTVVGLFRNADLVDHWRIATVAERTSDEPGDGNREERVTLE